MNYYKEELIKLLDRLSDKSIERIYRLANYLFIYKEDYKEDARHEKEISQKDFQNLIGGAGHLDS